MRELFNAITGFYDLESDRIKNYREYMFFAAQYNASRTAWDKKQSKNIMREKPPWVKEASNKPKEVNMNKLYNVFKALAKD